MEDFRRQFLIETAEKLENLQRNLLDAENFSSIDKRQIFRVLHTIKGTAQTFGYAATSRLAHDLETLLNSSDGKNLLIEGVNFLQKSLIEDNFQLPEAFSEKLRAVVPNSSADVNSSNNSTIIPAEFYSQLSNREKEIIKAAKRDDKSLAVLETAFNLANFAAELINFREILSSEGEIVATFSGAQSNAHGKIGFQFLIIGLENADVFAAGNGTNVVWENLKGFSTNDLDAVLRQIVRHGKEIAAKFNKKIEFELESGELNLSSKELKIVFELLLHLVRNAIDHAIEKDGKIKISLKEESDALYIVVSDEGSGIDFERVKTRAVEANLISKNESLSESMMLDLIFQPEFSTKTEITEVSGRGVGLDVVKSVVEKAHGKISVKTKKGEGTRFEIILPRWKN